MARRRARWVALTLVLLAAAGFLWARRSLAFADARHARFLQTGQSVKGFLEGYCDALELAAAGEPAAVDAFYSADYFSPGRGDWEGVRATGAGAVRVDRLRRSNRRDYSRAEALAALRRDLDGFVRLERAECKIRLFEELAADAVTLSLRRVLSGWGSGEEPMERRDSFRWRLGRGSNDPTLGWRIVAGEPIHGVGTVGAGGFERLDLDAAGIDFRHRFDPRLVRETHAAELRFDVMAHASGGLSAADYNRDGLPDLFFADGVDSRLFRNEGVDDAGRPRFRDVTRVAGLAGIDRATAALFVDFDGDGDRDLFVTRYLAPSLFFVNEGGVFRDGSAGSGLDFTAPASSATALDFDRDGDLDLYVGVYGDAFAAFPRIPFFATNGGANRLLRNDGAGRFTDVAPVYGAADTGWTLAVASVDYDLDGWPDLALANDFGRKVLLRNVGGGGFTDRAREAGVLDFSGGMGLVFGDLDGDRDGRPDLYTSNIQSNTRWFGEEATLRQYGRNVLRSRWALLDLTEYWKLYRLVEGNWRRLGREVGEGNGLFVNAGDGTFDERRGYGAEIAGWSWGVAAFDYDNDADLDLYAANGWISGKPDTDL